MKKIILLTLCSLFIVFASAQISEESTTIKSNATEKRWENYFVGDVKFTDLSPDTKGSEIYNHIIPNPDKYIKESARKVLQTLYFTPKDSIPKLKTIEYTIKDYDGISAKGGSGSIVDIVYSTRWIEKCFAEKDTTKLDFETRGVLYHELTHAYQLEPQGCGTYGDGGAYWAFIEGMADAVRLANGSFTAKDRPKGGTYMSGYRTTGFFLYWIAQTKDKDFLRKFNRSTLEVIPWSFDAAFKHILGKSSNCQIDNLWKEYQIAMGDIKK